MWTCADGTIRLGRYVLPRLNSLRLLSCTLSLHQFLLLNLLYVFSAFRFPFFICDIYLLAYNNFVNCYIHELKMNCISINWLQLISTRFSCCSGHLLNISKRVHRPCQPQPCKNIFFASDWFLGTESSIKGRMAGCSDG
jgi:hypothetical protein